MSAEQVAQNYLRIESRITAACERAGRDRSEVTLIGASKRQPLAHLEAAWGAGLRVFGENRVQEARDKAELLPKEIDWHLIGPLQSNKANLAARLFSTIHSVDRPKVARALDRAAGGADKILSVFLEVNLGAEDSKHGFAPDQLDAALELTSLERLEIIGLMAIPPFEAEPEAARGWFRTLRELRDELFANQALGERPGALSMGMSSDFEIAIEEGATHVRVGTSLFGPRPAP